MKNKYALICTFLLWCVSLSAQERKTYSLFGNQQPVRKVYNEQQRVQVPQRNPGKVTSRGLAKEKEHAEKKDTALFLSLTKRFGWYYGIGEPLTKKEAESLPCYYRLTEKDTLGHYTHIEAVNGMGIYTTDHELSTHLVGKANSSAMESESAWSKMLQTVVQLRLFPSIHSSYSSMESGYDANGNQIYTYILTQFNDSTFIGHYTDSFGEPVSLLAGESAAKYVQVIIDTLGYERQILCLDDDTYFKRNTDGAYMTKKEYDTQGNITRAISCMMNGIPIKDDWGNCGWYASYNARGQILRKTYVDEEMKPVRMGRKVKASVDVVSRHYEYVNNRLVREYYLTEKGEKDHTLEGVHCKEWAYDDRGNVLCISTRDVSNNLCDDRFHISQTYYRYEEHGGLASTWFKNKDSLYVNDENGICLYRGKNSYRTTTGHDTQPVYQEIATDHMVKTIDYKKKRVHVARYNDNNKEVESLYFNLNMEPVEEEGYYRKVTSYKSLPYKEVQEEMIYSFHDTLRAVTITDTKECTRLVQTFHEKTLLSSYGQTLSSDLTEVTGQYGYDALGNRARSHLEDALYYKVNSGSTYRGVTSYMIGRNEYDELSYVAVSEAMESAIYCTKLYGANQETTLLDEHNKKIENLRSLRDSLNKVFCIEILNQNAFRIGLRSGDVIVKYGDFYYPKATNDNWAPRDELQIETYLTRNRSKQLLVLRYIPQAKQHKMISITLPQGTPGEIGFLIQRIYYTSRESQRFNRMVEEYLAENNIAQDDFRTDSDHYGSKRVCLLRPYKVSTAEMPSWRIGLQEDVILIAVTNKLADASSTYVGINDGYSKLWDQAVADCDSTVVYYTSDGKTLKAITLPGTNSAISISSYCIPVQEYHSLLKMEEMVPAAVKREKPQSETLTPEQAYQYIATRSDSITCVHVEKGENNFEEGLSMLSSVLGVDITKKEIDSFYLLFVPAEATAEDKELSRTVLKKIDFSAYQRKEDDDIPIYYVSEDEDDTNISKMVLMDESFLFIIKGHMNLNK